MPAVVVEPGRHPLALEAAEPDCQVPAAAQLQLPLVRQAQITARLGAQAQSASLQQAFRAAGLEAVAGLLRQMLLPAVQRLLGLAVVVAVVETIPGLIVTQPQAAHLAILRAAREEQGTLHLRAAQEPPVLQAQARVRGRAVVAVAQAAQRMLVKMPETAAQVELRAGAAEEEEPGPIARQMVVPAAQAHAARFG